MVSRNIEQMHIGTMRTTTRHPSHHMFQCNSRRLNVHHTLILEQFHRCSLRQTDSYYLQSACVSERDAACPERDPRSVWSFLVWVVHGLCSPQRSRMQSTAVNENGRRVLPRLRSPIRSLSSALTAPGFSGLCASLLPGQKKQWRVGPREQP